MLDYLKPATHFTFRHFLLHRQYNTTMLFPLLFLLGLNAFANHVAGHCTSVINTSCGPVQGEYLCTASKNITYSSFKGIRYGKAPVGKMRFKPTRPADKWSELLSASSVGAECPQVGPDGKFTGDEDCLFLNVYTPVTNLTAKITKPKAVMVFIYGNLFSKGSGNPSLYGPDFLVENDVILVTFNYRVGAFGFLALDNRDCSGNVGLKDQRLALTWVQDNIAKFGGDPTRVTLIGESVGSVSALYHTLSSGSQGLFHRVIAMSGSPLNPWGLQSLSEATKNAFKLGSLLGKNCSSNRELLETLYSAPAKDIAINGAKLGYVDPPFRPVVENPKNSNSRNVILTKSPEEIYRSGQFSKIPHLMGVMADESLVYAGADSTRPEVIKQAKCFANKTNTYHTISSVYLAELTGKSSPIFIQETTDLLYNSGMEKTKRLIKTYGKESLYYYSVSFAPTNYSIHYKFFNVTESGASHGDDILYVFRVNGLGYALEETHPVSIVRARITRMFTNFAKCGNPTPLGKDDTLLNITWPEHRSSGQHLDINENLTLKNKSSNANIDAILSSCSCRAKDD